MGLVLDTSVIIASERGKFDLCGMLAKHRDESARISAATVSELLHGWERGEAGKRRDRRKQFVEDIFKTFLAIPFDLEVARIHANLWARLEKQGAMIGAHDLIIAATCVYAGDSLATLNHREFCRIDSLQLIDCQPWQL